MTITLPVHPLRDRPLPVVRDGIRGQDGRRYVEVEHPRGWTLRVPVEWTDRSVPPVPAVVDGRPVLLSPAGLLELAGMLEASSSSTLDGADTAGDLPLPSDPSSPAIDATSRSTPLATDTALGGSAGECAGDADRRLGCAGPRGRSTGGQR